VFADSISTCRCYQGECCIKHSTVDCNEIWKRSHFVVCHGFLSLEIGVLAALIHMFVDIYHEYQA